MSPKVREFSQHIFPWMKDELCLQKSYQILRKGKIHAFIYTYDVDFMLFNVTIVPDTVDTDLQVL